MYYTVGSKSRIQNQERLIEILDRLKIFLNANKMTINKSKTILMEAMLVQKECKSKGQPPKLSVTMDQGNIKELAASKECLVLGTTIHKNLQWQAHLETGEEVILPILRKIIGMLKFLSKNIPKQSKKLLAEGLILSKILYTLSLYGGLQQKYMNKMQIILNKTDRVISGLGRRAKMTEIMKEIKWLNMKELIDYHSLTFLWRIIRHQAPLHIVIRLSLEDKANISVRKPRLQNSERLFTWRTVQLWNEMSQEMKVQKSLPIFKWAVKKWILNKQTPEPGD